MANIEAPRFKAGEAKAPKPKPVDLEAKVAPPSYRSFNHLSGTVSSGRLRYTDVYAFAWWRGGDPEAPVRLELSEDTGSRFTEVRIQADYLPSRTRDFGQDLSLSAEGRPSQTLYRSQIRRLEDRELLSVGAETMLTRLQNFEPETLRVKGPFTPKTALETMLTAWQREAPWLRYAPPSELFVRKAVAQNTGPFTANLGDGLFAPQLGALVLEQPTDLSASKTSAYGWLERFFKLFAEYRFRINQAGELAVVGPRVGDLHLILGSREEPLALSARLYHFKPRDDSDEARNRAREDAGTPRARHIFAWGARRVRLWLDVYEVKPDYYHVETFGGEPLSAGQEIRRETPAGHSVVIRLEADAFTLEIVDTDLGRDYRVRGYVESVEAAPSFVKRLANSDVGFGVAEVTDFEGVVNRCSVTSQGYAFAFEQELLEPSYALFRDNDSVLDGKYTEPDEQNRKKITSVWSAPESTIIGAGTLQAAVNIEAYSRDGNVKNFGLDVTLPVGEAVRVFVERQTGSLNVSFELEFTLRFTGTEVQLFGASWTGSSGFNDFEPTAYIVLLNAAGEKFARSEKRIFQLADESQGSPYGVRREDIDAGPFPLSNEVALAIAQRRVAEAKEPKSVLSFEQSPRLPILPDDLHKSVELPDGRRGVVTSWSYAEAHTPQGSLSRSSVKVRLEHVDEEAL